MFAVAWAAGAAPKWSDDTVSGSPATSRVLIQRRVTVGADHIVIKLTLYPADMTASKFESTVRNNDSSLIEPVAASAHG